MKQNKKKRAENRLLLLGNLLSQFGDNLFVLGQFDVKSTCKDNEERCNFCNENRNVLRSLDVSMSKCFSTLVFLFEVTTVIFLFYLLLFYVQHSSEISEIEFM